MRRIASSDVRRWWAETQKQSRLYVIKPGRREAACTEDGWRLDVIGVSARDFMMNGGQHRSSTDHDWPDQRSSSITWRVRP